MQWNQCGKTSTIQHNRTPLIQISDRLNKLKINIFCDQHVNNEWQICVCDHQSVCSIERLLQTIKQIMMKNAEDAWLAMLIFRATDIPGVNKSPSKILNRRKFRTGLPMIDVHRKSTADEIEKLSEKHSKMTSSGKELAKLPLGTKVPYEHNPDSDKTKRP